MIPQFSPELEEMIRQEMAASGYAKEDDLLLDALRAFRQQRYWELDEEAVLGIKRGLNNLADGQVEPFSTFDVKFRATNEIPTK